MPDLERLVESLARELDRAGIEHAFGSAVALSYWAPPQATVDIDLNLFLPESGLDVALAAVEAAGFQVDRDAARKTVSERGDFRAWCGAMRLDAFTSFSPFHDEVARRRVVRPLPDGTTIRVLSAEDLMLFKILLDRPKDWIDIEKTVRQQGEGLDRAYVGRWLAELLPTGDPRVQRFQALR